MRSFLVMVTPSRLFGGLTAVAGYHAFEPALDDGFRLPHDTRHQFGAARDVVDQSLHLSCGPDAFIGIAVRVDHFAAGAGDEIANLLEGCAFLLHGDYFGADRISRNARGVTHGTKNQLGLALVIGDDFFLDPLMDRALFGAHEARAHIDAFGAQRQSRDQAAAVPRQRVTHAGAFVNDHNAVLLEFGDVLLRLVAGGLDDLDAALDDGLAIFRVRRRLDRGQGGRGEAGRL